VDRATRIVVLQADALRYLPAAARQKATVIYQSCHVPKSFRATPRRDVFEVIVIGHLRDVKDPLRTAAAARQLPATSRIVVTHLGAPLDQSLARQAWAEMKVNPRYRWLGEVPREEALMILGRGRLLVVSSCVEGAPNVASEAIALGVPVLSTKISGMIGLFGRDYPGYFAVGDTDGLSRLLAKAEADAAFFRRLSLAGQRVKKLVAPVREANAWRRLLSDLAK
jgi:glycosyltransferase involved in cell wall biosynthesis